MTNKNKSTCKIKLRVKNTSTCVPVKNDEFTKINLLLVKCELKITKFTYLISQNRQKKIYNIECICDIGNFEQKTP